MTLQRRYLAHLAVVVALLLIVLTSEPVEACEPTPITEFTPTGIAGCERWGSGIASMYGPGDGVAMNFCTWDVRHTVGCGSVTISANGVSVTVPVVDYCDCYTGTPDERIVDLQYGVVAALGLDRARGLWPVTVERAGAVVEAPRLPNTAVDR